MIKQVLTVLAALMGLALIVAALQGRPSLTTPATASEPPEIAAQKDLPSLIEGIQVDAQGFGFTDEQEVTEITLGRPYQLYDLNYDQAQNYTPNLSAEHVLIPEQRWEFPVLLDGQAKGMAALATEDGELRFVGFSSNAELAQNLVDFQAKYDRAGEEGPIKLLRISPLYTNFALTQYDGQPQVTLLSEVEASIERAFLTNLDASQTQNLKEVVPQIVQEIKELNQNAPIEE